MFRGSRHRAALVLPEAGLDRLVVRNRRPGDRLRPLGAPGERKLKDLLIDRRVPRRERDRLPLLVVAGRIAWVPGVTVGDAFRLPGRLRDEGGEVWIVEIRREGEHLDRDPEPTERT
jgi:tRNA(Ile)-lysidine synthase